MFNRKSILLICIVITAVFICNSLSVFAFSDVDMKFSSASDLSAWVYKKGGTMELGTVGSEACFKITPAAVETTFVRQLAETVESDGKNYVFSYRMYIPSTNSNANTQMLHIMGRNSSNVPVFYGLKLYNGVIRYPNATGNYNSSNGYDMNGNKLTVSAGNWYDLKTNFDRRTGVCTYYVNDNLVYKEDGTIAAITVAENAKSTEVTHIALMANTSNATDVICVNGISVKQMEQSLSEFLYDDFDDDETTGWTLTEGTAAIATQYVDDDHKYAAALSSYNAYGTHTYQLENELPYDKNMYILSWDVMIPNINKDTSKPKQTVYISGKTSINAFYAIRVDNGVISYYNGETSESMSTAYKNGVKWEITEGEWHNFKTLYDRSTGEFIYFVDNEPIRQTNGDVVSVKANDTVINENITKVAMRVRTSSETDVIYVDNVILKQANNKSIPENVDVYNLAVKNNIGNNADFSDISNDESFTVSYDYNATRDFTVIAALYSEDKLMDVVAHETQPGEIGTACYDSFSFTNDENADTLKIFVWDNFLTARPFMYKLKNDEVVSIQTSLDSVSKETSDFVVKTSNSTIKTTVKNSVTGINLKAPVVEEIAKYDSKQGKATNTYYINFNVKNKEFLNVIDGSKYELEVEYFDEGYGCFTLEYNCLNKSFKEAEYVELNNTMQWKKHTFSLDRAIFTGNDVDFRLATWGALMRYSNSDVAFSKVLLRKSPIRDQYTIKSTGSAVGNIYYTGQTVSFDTTVSSQDFPAYSKTLGTYTATLKYTLLDENGNAIKTLGEKDITINPNSVTSADTLTFNVDKYGLYFLKAEVISEKYSLHSQKITEFSYVNSDRETVNPDYGTSAQVVLYESGKEGVEVLAKNAGIGNVRWIRGMKEVTSVDYSSGTPTLSTMSWPLEWTKYESVFQNNGYSILNNLLSAGMVYSDETASGYKLHVPYGETGRKLYAEYCKYFAKQYKAKYPNNTRYYEIWNEFDSGAGTSFNMNGEGVKNYGDLLVKAADAVYSNDKDAQIVVAGSRFVNTHRYAIERVQELLAQGEGNNKLADYFKIASIHPYHWNYNPMDFESTEFNNTDYYNEPVTTMYQHLYELRKVYDSYGLEDTKLWITELAWSPHYNSNYKEKPITEKQQGSYLVQSYVMAKKNNLVEKFMPYLFARQTNVRVDRDRNMGIIKSRNSNEVDVPYAATSAYLAVANLNMMMTGATYVSDFMFNSNTATAYRYTRRNGEDMAILWSILENGENVSINLGCNTITVYDEYGNATVRTSSNGIYDFNLTQSTVYVTGDFTRFNKG